MFSGITVNFYLNKNRQRGIRNFLFFNKVYTNLIFNYICIVKLTKSKTNDTFRLKTKGAYFEFERERNEELLRAFMEESAKHPNEDDATFFAAIVKYPSSRFWVSEERAAIVISEMCRGIKLDDIVSTETKRRMYGEIYDRYIKLKSERSNNNLQDLIYEVVNSPAPEFYLEPGTARVVISKTLSNWYRNRRLKQFHLD